MCDKSCCFQAIPAAAQNEPGRRKQKCTKMYRNFGQKGEEGKEEKEKEASRATEVMERP